MPPAGYKSITIPESVYDKFQKQYEKEKHLVESKGVFSFSGYMTYRFNLGLKNEIA